MQQWDIPILSAPPNDLAQGFWEDFFEEAEKILNPSGANFKGAESANNNKLGCWNLSPLWDGCGKKKWNVPIYPFLHLGGERDWAIPFSIFHFISTLALNQAPPPSLLPHHQHG